MIKVIPSAEAAVYLMRRLVYKVFESSSVWGFGQLKLVTRTINWQVKAAGVILTTSHMAVEGTFIAC